jgi:TPP-dependent pyruvate/acetoin dehydrogenase alpha subunit
LENKMAKEITLQRIQEDIQEEIEGAVAYAENSPFPDPLDALKDVFSES